jgi:MFS family permease
VQVSHLTRALAAEGGRVERWVAGRLRRALGGRARMQVIVLFACVLGLNTADLSSLGAIAGQLKLALHIDNTQLGVLAAAPALVAAVFTLPFGVLADRTRRVSVLVWTIVLWAAAMIVCGAASSFTMLLFVRMALGAVAAAAGPLVASLVGDLFAPAERGRVYGYIVAGELLGTLVGLLVAGNLAALSWRASLWLLAVPSFALAIVIHRTLPEPARGGASRLRRGDETVRAAEEVERDGEDRTPLASAAVGLSSAGREDGREAVARLLRRRGIEPRPELVLHRDPDRMPLHAAVRYVLRVKTNVRLIIASALGYFFQAGVNTFGVVFLAAQFKLTQSAATSLLAVVAIGALLGTLGGGRLSDVLLGRGRIAARMVVGGSSFILSTLIFVPGLLGHSLAFSLALYFLAAVALAAPNGALDAARLDVMPARLRGRAEAVRTTLRTLAVAIAPLAFGFVSDQLASGPRTSTKGIAYSVSATGLKYTFLLMLLPMGIGGVILLRGHRGYGRDVATALASEAELSESSRPGRFAARADGAAAATGS